MGLIHVLITGLPTKKNHVKFSISPTHNYICLFLDSEVYSYSILEVLLSKIIYSLFYDKVFLQVKTLFEFETF